MLKKAEEYTRKEGIHFTIPDPKEYEEILKKVIKAKPQEITKENRLQLKRKAAKTTEEDKV
jgi:AAA+ superfamily predicted ATPase